MTKAIYIVFLISLLVGCSSSPTGQALESADSLLMSRNISKADSLLNEIDTAKIRKGLRSYYRLLRCQSDGEKGIVYTDTAYLDNSIEYFGLTFDYEKLARTYHYKAVSIYNNNHKSFFVLEKYAECALQKADQTERKTLVTARDVYQALAIANLKHEEYDLAAANAKLAINNSEKLNDRSSLALLQGVMALCFKNMGIKDSMNVYVNNCRKSVKYADKDHIKYVYTILADVFLPENPEEASVYISKALTRNVDPYTLFIAAKYHKAIGDIEKSKALYLSAIDKMMACQLKVDAYKALAELSMRNGDEMLYRKYISDAMAIKDSVYAHYKADEIRNVQNETRTSQKWENTLRTMRQVIALVVFVFLLYIMYSKKKMSWLRRNADIINRKRCAEDSRHRREIMKERQNSIHQAQRLEKEKKTISEKISTDIIKGKVLYYGLVNNDKNVSLWTKENYNQCIAYCNMEFGELIKNIHAEYKITQQRNLLVVLLKEQGYDNEKIGRIYSVQPDSVRRMINRLKDKK